MTATTAIKLIILPLSILALILYAAWAVYDYGQYRAGFDQARESAKLRKAEKTNSDLQARLSDFRTRVAQLESVRKVDEYAIQAVKDNLVKMELRFQALREELQFYRTIVSPSKGREGLHIHDFKLTQNQKDDYNYNLTVIHIQGTRKHHRESYGEIRISIQGQQGGVSKKLGFMDVSTAKRSKIRYRFKYFSRFKGGLKLPKGFVPKLIEIQVVPRQKNIKGDIKTIKWPIRPV